MNLFGEHKQKNFG